MAIVRVGLLGLGEVAQSIHLPVLSEMRNCFQIAGVFDVSRDLMATVCSRYAGVRAFASAQALITDPAIDAVFVLTSDETHSGFVRQAVAADKHVLLEKPACLTVREIDELIALTGGYAKTVFVAYMRRYTPVFLAAKAELPSHADIMHVRIFDLMSVGRLFCAIVSRSSIRRTSTGACSRRVRRTGKPCFARWSGARPRTTLCSPITC